MSAPDGGWIKLWRKLRENPYLCDAVQRAVFLTLLLDAEHQPRARRHSKGVVTVGRGQALIAGRAMATELKVGHQQIRRAIANLKKGGIINTQSSTHFTVVTICNFDKYQSYEVIAQHVDQHTIQHRPNTDPTQLQEGEEVKEGKNKNPSGNGHAKPDLDAEFDSWWSLWTIPGTKRSKGDAQKAYRAARKRTERHVLAAALEQHVRRWTKDGTSTKYIPYPATWLNGRRWEDDIRDPPSKPERKGMTNEDLLNYAGEDYPR